MKAITMKKTKTEKMEETSKNHLLGIMEDELSITLAAYEELLNQCSKLADSMGYRRDYVIGKIMPRTATDRYNVTRISKWFDSTKKDAVEHMLKLELKREQDRERERLIASLQLTQEQKALLGIS